MGFQLGFMADVGGSQRLVNHLRTEPKDTHRAAPCRAGNRGRGARLLASGAGCRVLSLSLPLAPLQTPSSPSSIATYESPGAAAFTFQLL